MAIEEYGVLRTLNGQAFARIGSMRFAGCFKGSHVFIR